MHSDEMLMTSFYFDSVFYCKWEGYSTDHNLQALLTWCLSQYCHLAKCWQLVHEIGNSNWKWCKINIRDEFGHLILPQDLGPSTPFGQGLYGVIPPETGINWPELKKKLVKYLFKELLYVNVLLLLAAIFHQLMAKCSISNLKHLFKKCQSNYHHS